MGADAKPEGFGSRNGRIDRSAMGAKGTFAGKVAMVTGAASGIGRATAIAFASEGANVVLADVARQTDAGQTAVAEIEGAGGKALFVACDVANEGDINRLIARTMEAFGRLDAAFNNAGIEGEQGETHLCKAENWDRVMSINLRGVWLCMKAEIAQMLAHGGGAIVNCSSIAGLVGFANTPAYTASKHGVIGLTRAAALEYAQRNIRVNAVCPGVIETPMIDRYVAGDPKAREALIASEPIGRIGTPQEIASAVLWLCSPGASFTTGQSLAVDGGWVAR
jgi:NAD(P)-dependent dehydrogenase (short-subunit alcohol dehydrogenase family)